MILIQSNQVKFVRRRLIKCRKVRSSIDSDDAVVNVAATNLILGRNIIIHAGHDELGISKIRSHNREAFGWDGCIIDPVNRGATRSRNRSRLHVLFKNGYVCGGQTRGRVDGSKSSHCWGANGGRYGRRAQRFILVIYEEEQFVLYDRASDLPADAVLIETGPWSAASASALGSAIRSAALASKGY